MRSWVERGYGIGALVWDCWSQVQMDAGFGPPVHSMHEGCAADCEYKPCGLSATPDIRAIASLAGSVCACPCLPTAALRCGCPA